MAQLTVRNVDDDISAALKARAARTGRSAEAEHRRILKDALRPARSANFFNEARTRRIKLTPGGPTTTDLLRDGRDRNEG